MVVVLRISNRQETIREIVFREASCRLLERSVELELLTQRLERGVVEEFECLLILLRGNDTCAQKVADYFVAYPQKLLPFTPTLSLILTNRRTDIRARARILRLYARLGGEQIGPQIYILISSMLLEKGGSLEKLAEKTYLQVLNTAKFLKN